MQVPKNLSPEYWILLYSGWFYGPFATLDEAWRAGFGPVAVLVG